MMKGRNEKGMAMTPRLGQQFGNYRLIRLLGRGGFAEVYLGEHVYLQTQAALKILHTRLTDQSVQDFFQEARLIASLKHPHIVSVLDFAVQEDVPFLVMSYASEGSLRTLHPTGTILPANTILAYVKDVASALQHAHDHQLVHRDIKPGNMLVLPDHGVLLSDFGIATVPQSAQHLWSVMGTPTYMAPEQGQGRPCAASDQYALAVVVYEWLCGSPPFSGSALEISIQHVTTLPPPLREKVPTIHPEIEQVVLTALNKEPQRRFPSVSGFAAALEQAMIGAEATSTHATKSPPLSSSSHPKEYIGRLQQRPLIGREQEQDLWRQFFLETEHCFSQLSPGSSTPSWEPSSRITCLLFSGEAGVGKTRLAEEMAREAHQRGWSVVWSRLFAQEQDIPYSVWTMVLRTALSQGLWTQVADQPVSHLYHPLTTLLPELAHLLSAESPSETVGTGPEPLYLWELVLTVLTAIGVQKPLLLVLDDLHYLDTKSRELFGYLVRRLARSPILMVGTSRNLPSSHAFCQMMAQLQREHLLFPHHISALSDAQIVELVPDLPEPLVGYIQRQAAGNPFFAEELALVLLNTQQGRDNRVSSTPMTALPETITAVLNQRYLQLSRSCQSLLSSASVLGNTFTFSMLHAMTRSMETFLDEATMLALIEEALQAGVLTESEEGVCISYHFWHPLFLSHVYQQLSAARRVFLHRQAAQALQLVYGTHSEASAALITYHLLQGGSDAQHITHFAELAAHSAYGLAAYPEAERYYRVVLEHGWGMNTSEQGEYSWSGRHAERGGNQLACLLEYLGECLRNQGKYQEARHVYQQALHIRSQSGSSGVIDQRQHEIYLQAMLWAAIGLTYYDAGNCSSALQCYAQGKQLLLAVGVKTGYAWATLLKEQGYVYWREGKYGEARATAWHALKLFEEELQKGKRKAPPTGLNRIQRTLAGDLINLGDVYILLGLIAGHDGQFTEARTHWLGALQLYTQLNSQREIAIVCCNLGDLHSQRSEYSLAQEFLYRSLAIAQYIGEMPLIGFILGNLGILTWRCGELIEAEKWLKQGVDCLDEGSAGIFYSSLALVLQDQGKHAEARTNMDSALTQVRNLSLGPQIGRLSIALGSLLLGQALDCERNEERPCRFEETGRNLLEEAERSFHHGLAQEGLEAEIRIEGQVTLAQTQCLLGEQEEAYRLVQRTLTEAKGHELSWLVARAQRLLGSLLHASGRLAESTHTFEQALEFFQRSGMRLEYARTLQQYGLSLLQSKAREEEQYQRGLAYLYEACGVFNTCHAYADLRRVERLLIPYANTVTAE